MANIRTDIKTKKIIELLDELTAPINSNTICLFLKYNERTCRRLLKVMLRKKIIDFEYKKNLKNGNFEKFYKPINNK